MVECPAGLARDYIQADDVAYVPDAGAVCAWARDARPPSATALQPVQLRRICLQH